MVTQNSENNRAKKAAAGLRPFKLGQSGNPGGRPKTAAFAEEVRKYLREKQGGKTRLRHILEKLQKEEPEILLHYAFGKPKQHVEHSGSVVAGPPDHYLQLLRECAAKL